MVLGISAKQEGTRKAWRGMAYGLKTLVLRHGRVDGYLAAPLRSKAWHGLTTSALRLGQGLED